MTTYVKHKKALNVLNQCLSQQALFIHYSCESFYDYTRPGSRRVTSIAVRYSTTSQTKSFSIHLSAELRGTLNNIQQDLDSCERMMLDDFFDFVKKHEKGYIWLHWNMRDSNYGFEAINHRYKSLNGSPVEIADANKYDLSPILIDIYGKNYTGHPRLDWLVERNDLRRKTYLTGAEEAQAFEEGRFVALHQSTLTKVQTIAEIAELASQNKLKNQSTWWTMFGSTLSGVGQALVTNWIFILITTVSGIALGVIGVLLAL